MPPARTVRQKGSITLELIIAFAVAALVLTSVILLTGSSDALALERESTESAIARQLIANALHASSTPVSIASSSTRDRIPFHAALSVFPATPCLNIFQATATSTGGVGDGVAFSAWSPDIEEAKALGGDCDTEPATSTWQRMVPQATAAAGTATAVDVLGQSVYVGISSAPYFATFTASGTQVAFTNGFALPETPHALDAAYVSGNPYVFAAMASSSNQLMIIDVSDPRNPVIVASSSLTSVDPKGADPAAYRVRFDAGRLYVTTRYIAGPQPELHIFDVHDPAHSAEIGSASLETTVNGMAVRSVNGRVYLFAATTYDTRELAVYDVTDATRVQLVASADLPGTQDGDSVAIQGDTLYLGRASNTAGPELYAIDISNPLTPVLIGSAEVTSKDITAVVPMGSLLFMAATNDGASNRMVEVWNIHDPSHMALVSAVKDSGLALSGIDYARDQLFAVGATTLSMYAGN